MKKGLYFEDYEIGAVYPLPSRRISANEIQAFALRFDPRPMHTDPSSGEASYFGGLIASGFHSMLLFWSEWVAMKVDEGPLIAGMSIDRTEWKQPVRPDVLYHAEVQVKKKRRFSSGTAGSVTVVMNVTDEEGQLVTMFEATAMVACRPPQNTAKELPSQE